MKRIFDITAKDLLQLVRDRNTFLFLLIMPIAFTFLFGYAFSGDGSTGDSRLPVGYLSEDQGWLNDRLHDQLAASDVIRLVQVPGQTRASLEQSVAGGDLLAAIIVPAGYGHATLEGRRMRLVLIADTSTPAGSSVESDLLSALQRVENAVQTALILERVAGDKTPFDYTFDESMKAWGEAPITIENTTSSAIPVNDPRKESLSHSSPGMMLQFAIAGLLTSARMLVTERKTRCLKRMLTTDTARIHILLGHFIAIFLMILAQFLLLILFAQFVFGLDYFSQIQGHLLVAFTAAFAIAGMGLLIGTLAQTEEQAVVLSIVPMFVLAGLGGAMVPLEVTGPTFQVIGHISPVAWGMDGFKNLLIRGLGFDSVLLPAAALAGYGLLFFILSAWRFRTE